MYSKSLLFYIKMYIFIFLGTEVSMKILQFRTWNGVTARTALQLQSGRKYIYNVSSFVRGLSPIVTPWYAIKSWHKNIFNGLLVLLLALVQRLIYYRQYLRLCARIISLILEAKWSPSAPLWTYEPASSWHCLFPTLQWPRQLRLGKHQHQHQGHHHQGDLETDKASPPAPAADEELEKNGRKWQI